MNQEQALTILYEACASFKGNLQEHNTIQNALNFVKTELQNKVPSVNKDKVEDKKGVKRGN